jgi:hypothetical protein
MALANSLMRLGRPLEAQEQLLPVEDHPRVMEMLVHCCRMLGDHQKERSMMKRWMNQKPQA